MQRQLTAFINQPGHATYMAARKAVLAQSPLPMNSTDIVNVERLLTEEEYQDVLDRIDALPLSKVLSPRIHFLAAEAADALGDEETVELERWLFVLALRGLLSTGDGSRANPYVVCHAADEHDILDSLVLEAASHSLLEKSGRLLDVVLCTDGRETCFDVTETLVTPRKTQRRRGKRPARPRRLRAVGNRR
jgi:hypothetical protein